MNPADGAIQYALAQLGKPYKWGATGPNAFDCSGLVYKAYGSVGIKLPRTSYQMLSVGKAVSSKRDLAVGDLIFPNLGHVALYMGSDQMIESPHTGAVVRVINVYSFWRGRRITVPGGGAGIAQSQPVNPNEQEPPQNLSTSLAGCLPSSLMALIAIYGIGDLIDHWIR